MSDLLVGQLLNDFVDVFQEITRTRNRKKAVWRINNGLCGMAAMAVGNVLIHGYGYDPKRVEWRSHCLHMWLRVDGVDYDTMFPQGYSRSVVDEWLLPLVSYATGDGGEPIECKEDNSGYMQPHLWYCQLLNEVFYKRYSVEPPQHVIDNRKRWFRTADTSDWRSGRRYEPRAKRALMLPLKALVSPVCDTGVLPLLNYYYGEFEETTTRKLLNLDFDNRGVSRGTAVRHLKRLAKESREKGIHCRRL